MFIHTHDGQYCEHKWNVLWWIIFVHLYIMFLRINVIIMWSAVAQWQKGGLAIERARVRIPFTTVSMFGHVRSFHDASVDSAV